MCSFELFNLKEKKIHNSKQTEFAKKIKNTDYKSIFENLKYQRSTNAQIIHKHQKCTRGKIIAQVYCSFFLCVKTCNIGFICYKQIQGDS